MKSKSSLAIAIGILLAFVVGVLIGLILTNPGRNVIEVVGAIGKVDKYRNVTVTTQDIELRNDLITDESLKEAYQSYLMVEYTSNVKMADDIKFATEAASQAPGFKTIDVQTISKLKEYVVYLDNARLQILEAIATLDDLDRKGHIAIRTVLNKAGNALAQTKYRSNVLFAFLHDIEQFLYTAGKDDHPQLAKAHDLLLANLFFSGIINGNSPDLKYLSTKELFTENENLALKAEALQTVILLDVEKLRTGFTDQESLHNFLIRSEYANAVYFFDSESLQRILDSEQIGSFRSSSDFLNLLIPLGNATSLQGAMQNKEVILGWGW